MSTYKQKTHLGKPVLTRAWRDFNNAKASTVSTLIWNFISWGIVLSSERGNISVNGVFYRDFNDAFAAQPLVTSIIFLFPLLGLLMGYHTLALWINETKLKIENEEFIIQRGPLFWQPSEIKIPVSDIKQAYVQEYRFYSENREPIVRYRLMVQRYSCGDTVLESGIIFYNDAHMLEKWLEENIGIQNESVPGEVEIKKAS